MERRRKAGELVTRADLEERIRAIPERKRRSQQDVQYLQAHHPELAEWLTDMTAEFGRCHYRVTLRHVDKGTRPFQKAWRRSE